MQQTQKYKLNLIESSDPFLPDALNANTRKLEEVVSGHLEGMDQRVQVLEAKRFAYGTFLGPTTSAPVNVSLPFAPTAVIAGRDGLCYMDVKGSGNQRNIYLTENGFAAIGLNQGAHMYIAFG